MTEIIALVVALFIAPYILIAVLWSRMRRLEGKLDQTIAWASGQLSRTRPQTGPETGPEAGPSRPDETAEAAQSVAESAASQADPLPNVSEPEAGEPTPAVIPATRSEPDSSPQPDPQPEQEPEQESERESLAASVAYAAASHDAEPVAIDEDEATKTIGAKLDFEDIFGRRLPIWGGGIALAIAGVFLVRYSIEAGLVTPAVRVLLSFAFGLGLVAGAEIAYRFATRIDDDRVRQALAGAGIATLFGAFYLAGTSYGLIGAGAAFLGLAAVTAAAIAMSFRFGLPCAILGLLGGFAAPVLIESESANVPLLALYLALVTGGLAWTGERQGRRWLGYAALAAGLGWGVLMQLLGLASSTDVLALGLYLVVLGTVLPAFLHREGGASIPQLAAAGIATLQMAVLVSNAGFDLLTWGQYILISAALAFLAWRSPKLRAGSGVAALVGMFMLGLWWDAPPFEFAIVAGALTLIFAGAALAYHWRGSASLIETAMLAGVPPVVGAVAYLQFASVEPDAFEGVLAATMIALALFPLAGLVLRFRATQAGGENLSPRADLPLVAASHGLVFAAGLLITPGWSAPLIAAALTLVGVGLLWRREEKVLLIANWAAVTVMVAALAVTPDYSSESLRLVGQGPFDAIGTAIGRWTACCIALLALGAVRPASPSRLVADGLAAVLAYGAAAQFIPAPALAWLAAVAAIAVVVLRSERIAGWAALLAIAGLWTTTPTLAWITAGGMALSGAPFLVSDAIAPIDLAKLIAPFVAAALVAAWRANRLAFIARNALLFAAGGFGIIAAHSLFKLVFAIASMLGFEHYGLAERTAWQALFLGAALLAARVLPVPFAHPARIALLGTGLAHFTWFSLLVHNPLFTVQHVGPTPAANLLLAAYGVAITALALLREDAARLSRRARQALDIAIMVLVCLLAVSLLRQVFAGSVLTSAQIGANESLLLSILGIALALGFLWWGSLRQERIWRIGSLVLMLGAVGKVFLIDAAGLSGLLRIASFMALGFSLIGIGWVYSRQLRRVSDATQPDTGLSPDLAEPEPSKG